MEKQDIKDTKKIMVNKMRRKRPNFNNHKKGECVNATY